MEPDGALSRDSVGEAWPLNASQRAQTGALLALLEHDEHAPTSIRDRAGASDRHLADSLAALTIAPLREARTIADLGSGSGFPGLAVAVALPAAVVSLVESQRRRCEFLERARTAASLANVRVVCARAEEWSEGRLCNDAVLARALAPQAVVLEYAAPLLRVGGTLVDWRGERDAGEEQAADRAAALLGLERADVLRVVPFAGATHRHLHVFTKVADTPERFPRRPGMALKRPVGR
ncbi:MAG TPA: 16S rRNA (guanine(527)-N(7))-methyltransferase RsmG [Solirubrobacteraceae bacterium]|jgi:16S rRNA (guanine527-N7)-methyltransferase